MFIFRAHAERIEIETRLDGEPCAGEQPSIIVGFVIVHVHTVAVHVAPEIMPGSMQNSFPKPRLLEHVPRRAIDLPPTQIALVAGCLPDQGRGRVASLPDGLERPGHLVGNSPAGKAYPRNIGIYGARVVLFLRPQVQQHELVGADLPGAPGRRQVMRIARVFLRRHDGARVAD